MSPVPELLLLLLLICAVDFHTATPPQDVTAKPGEDVPLLGRGPRGAAVTLIVWNRSDLESDKYVFFFRDDKPNEHFQLPSFRGRVQLRDPEMKDGGASVVLKNVTISDSGTYECRVSAASRRRKRNTPELISTIQLTVTDSGLTAGHTEGGGTKDGGTKDRNVGLQVGLPVVVLVGVVGFMIFRNRSRRTENNSYQPPADEEAEHFGLTVTAVGVMMIVGFVVFWKHQRSVKKNSEQLLLMNNRNDHHHKLFNHHHVNSFDAPASR